MHICRTAVLSSTEELSQQISPIFRISKTTQIPSTLFSAALVSLLHERSLSRHVCTVDGRKLKVTKCLLKCLETPTKFHISHTAPALPRGRVWGEVVTAVAYEHDAIYRVIEKDGRDLKPL